MPLSEDQKLELFIITDAENPHPIKGYIYNYKLWVLLLILSKYEFNFYELKNLIKPLTSKSLDELLDIIKILYIRRLNPKHELNEITLT